MRFSNITILVILVQLMQIGQIIGDLYTSVASLEDLLSTEIHLLNEFEEYFKQVSNTNQKIKNFLEKIESNFADVNETIKELSQDPLYSFKQLKRFAIDWKGIELTVNNDYFANLLSANITQMVKDDYVNASQADLVGASNGLVRLQHTYALNTEDISNGILLDTEYESEMSAHDCFELGRTLYDDKKYQYAIEWLIRARILLAYEIEEAGYEDEKGTLDFPYLNDVEILEFLAPSMFNIGNCKMAVIFNNEILAEEPDNEYGLQNKLLFENKVIEERRFNHLMQNSDSTLPMKSQITEVDVLYESVCRGTVRQTPTEQRNLRCRYSTRDVPFCLIAPFKMEELSHDPFVAVYHDAIYDNEIEKIIDEAENNIERSQVGDVEEPSYSEIRISQNSWLYYNEHRFLMPIQQRLHDITGLNFLFAEPLQVANYGIGGHYGPHYDFTVDYNNDEEDGDRILTALFYINDVELGGATVFPYLRIAVPPIRGSLLVWFNMHESLELDYRTIHAGCPVLKGSKWICNEWFHEVGQEFLRPCSLDRPGNVSLPYKTDN